MRKALLATAVSGMLALAAPAAAADEQMCGDGTTFDVSLPGISGGAGDSVTLPKGCRIYALLVSGYSRNDKLDEFTFFNLAKFVAKNGGYVHWAWWNNLLEPYMKGPLRPNETLRTFKPTPGGLTGVHAAGFVPLSHVLGAVPKAVPEEDTQFQADAKKLLSAIRAENPTAIIVVAGHSMGGNAVARLGAGTPVDIDLLAPIDPVGNRSSPVGRPTAIDPRNDDNTFNWTRWRATREFGGFKVRDCIRNALGLCQNFGTLLNPAIRCATVGPLLSEPPAVVPPVRLTCGSPWIDPGKPLVFGGRIKRLYHRWQNEAVFPFDYPANYVFQHWAPRNAGGPTTAINYQAPVALCAGVTQSDPRDSNRLCNPTDGHGEIVGFRALTPGQPNPPGPNVPVAPLALQAPSGWPQYDADQTDGVKQSRAADRRYRLVRLADDDWPYRPMQPNLDLVSNDMVAIVQQLLDSQPAPTTPTTAATPNPGPNEHGWNNDDVTVNLAATTGAGRTITAIVFTLSGAQTAGPTVHKGDEVDVTISAEGDTTLTFYARDSGGNTETQRSLTVKLDKTPPQVIAKASPAPNSHGWNNTDVTVSFTAADALSGVDTVDPPLELSGEGAAQEAAGTAMDLAGNVAVAAAIVSIDRTPPLITGMPDPACRLWPPNGKLAQVATVASTDALSGVAPGSLKVAAASSEPDAGRGGARPGDVVVTADGKVQLRAERNGAASGRTYTVTASVLDLAGNAAAATAGCVVPHDQR